MQLAVILYYCKSLEYGSKHVYQSLPRLLYIWFDFASKILRISPEQERESQADHQALLEAYNTTLNQMSKCILNLFKIVPEYIFLTAFSQLISRICHPHIQVWDQLKRMIAGIVIKHPYQAVWMMMAVSEVCFWTKSMGRFIWY